MLTKPLPRHSRKRRKRLGERSVSTSSVIDHWPLSFGIADRMRYYAEPPSEAGLIRL